LELILQKNTDSVNSTQFKPKITRRSTLRALALNLLARFLNLLLGRV